jgi:hypothetical protein
MEIMRIVEILVFKRPWRPASSATSRSSNLGSSTLRRLVMNEAFDAACKALDLSGREAGT